MITLRELDERVTFREQLAQDTAPVVLINQFQTAPEDADRLVEVWADDAAFMKQQPGYICAQLYRGIAGSTTFVNVAV
jgi:heme-degrading monooxygenase HmoA